MLVLKGKKEKKKKTQPTKIDLNFIRDVYRGYLEAVKWLSNE